MLRIPGADRHIILYLNERIEAVQAMKSLIVEFLTGYDGVPGLASPWRVIRYGFKGVALMKNSPGELGNKV